MPHPSPSHLRRARRVAGASLVGAGVLAMSGCALATLFGGMAASAQRFGDHEVAAEYTGLQGKSFAVVVSADRVIEAAEPELNTRITARINDILMQNSGAAYGIPSRDLLAVLYSRPQWHAMQPSDVAAMLGVERLVWVELDTYRLTEPGNQYMWDGLARGVVFVYATDGPLPDEPMFEKSIVVQFPDSTGYSRTDLPEAAVTTALSNRFIDRASWLFFDHKEANEIKY